jgi:hypothetical protein
MVDEASFNFLQMELRITEQIQYVLKNNQLIFVLALPLVESSNNHAYNPAVLHSRFNKHMESTHGGFL